MLRPLLFGLLVASSVVPSVRAQELSALVSTSAAAELLDHSVSDQELLHHDPVRGTRAALVPAALAAFFANDASGLVELPGDLDAVFVEPGAGADGAVYVSFASDGGGFEDGDLIQLLPTGAEVAVPENLLVLLIEAEDENVDLDAFHRDADGVVYFSFAEDEASLLLSGDQAGVVRDGAVLRWDPADPAASVLLTEDEVSAMVSTALGATTAIGDLKGLSMGPDGTLVFSVQSPSSHDATVFTEAFGGSVLPGFEEADFDFLDNEEFDALHLGVEAAPALVPQARRPDLGTPAEFSFHGGEPGTLVLMLGALGVGPSSLSTEGWGGMVLAQDALFSSTLHSPALLLTTSDGLGQAHWSVDVPLSLAPVDVFVQAYQLGPTVRSSAPALVELGQ